MRNKLKRSKKCKDGSYPSKDPQRTAEVTTVELAGSSSSNHEAPPAKDRHGSGVSAAGVPVGQEHRNTFCAEDIKIAPIFLRSAQHSQSQRGSEGTPGKPAEKLQTSVQSEDVQLVQSQQRLSAVSYLRKRCRGQLSPSTLHSCLKEIQTSNPAFPVRAVFNTLQKKTSLQDFGSTDDSPVQSSLQRQLKEKRKWGDETSERAHKRLRSSLTAEGVVVKDHCSVSAQGVQDSTVPVARKQSRGNKLSRSYRLRQQSGSPAGLVNNCEPLINHAESDSQSLKYSDILQRDSSFEDVLWTDKYSPQHSSEVIGNSASVNKLQSWLKKWKLRADCEERRKLEERNQEESSNDSWDCGDFQGDAGAEDGRKEPLCNTMLITGPPGVGKTAAVYACSQELGFKVFEVNCSSQRSGRHVLSQLKEATQSHLVEMSGKDPLKPTYFNNYNNKETLSGKTVTLKNVTSTLKKRAAQNVGGSSRKGKVNPSKVTLANYFKMKAKADHLHLGGLSPSEKPDGKTSGSPSPGSDQTVPQNKNTATSLILFEEVDVIFDDDVGFLTAIKTFMATTKRPVILTTNDSSFRERFNCTLEEIIFKTPSAVNVCSYLQLVGLAENARLELEDISSLLRLCGGDVRRCLLQLQLWVHSGGRWACQKGDVPKETTGVQLSEKGDNVDPQLPQCDTGCAATMLGLQPVTPKKLLNLLKCPFWSEMDMTELLRLLAESWRGGVPLLYANLELFLPIGAKGTSVHFLEKGTCSGLQSELALPYSDPNIQQLDGNITPRASATDSKSVRNMYRLSRRKYMPTMFDTTSSSSLTQNLQRKSSSAKRSSSRTPRSRDATDQNTAKVALDCLDALTDFFDLMSYLDATMPAAEPLVSGLCRPEAFCWTGAVMKDGLLDEMSEEEEEHRSWSQEKLLDIQAAVEGLGCHRCLWRMSEAWTEAQKYTQELGDTWWASQSLVSSKRQSLSFSVQPLCAPSVSQRRYELSRSVLGSKSFSLLGNREAVSVDYMPVLRYICRFQREQRQKEEPVRCLNYLSSTHLGLSKSTIQLLAED
ncbi:ATPase family AAA domain-containing protein 5b isoform X2 [Dicentrarchus labrax]|uniref:ATPase family AAA domain-containing protein 5b isoform X2 n=1 Tax=Dicentrarchus labrax TaxID=13489 RepID=UPI0021F5611C|nr:ATPase family AAA domain-containing protein 5b isoform X2 [Dicentrarchus labrax]